MNLRRLAVHTSNYGMGSLLVTLASFVSFPIFTRIFSVDEYGVLNLISSTLMLLVGIAKLGIQHSVVRFYSEIKTGKRGADLRSFCSTVVFGMAGLGLAVTAVWMIVSQVIPTHWWNDGRVTGLLLLTAILVTARTVDSGLGNLLRAQERSGIFSIYSVSKKYVGLALILVTLFFMWRNLFGFYAATIVAEVAAVCALGAWVFRDVRYSPRQFSPELFRSMLAFGFPMIGFELAGTLLAISDRYVIQAVLGSTELGIYSAGYNLCEYVQLILISAIGQAVMPMYVRIWEERGPTDTVRFIENSMHYYLLLALPVVAGLAAVSEDLLVLLASEKYRASAQIIPWVIGGLILDGMVVMAAAGLYIQKRTLSLAGLVIASTVLNIALNVLLVPRFGIVGAAVATLSAYFTLVLSTFASSRRYLSVRVPWQSAGKFGVMAFLMYQVVVHVNVSGGAVNLVAKVIVGMAVYALLILVIDRKTRDAVQTGIARFSSP